MGAPKHSVLGVRVPPVMAPMSQEENSAPALQINPAAPTASPVPKEQPPLRQKTSQDRRKPQHAGAKPTERDQSSVSGTCPARLDQGLVTAASLCKKQLLGFVSPLLWPRLAFLLTAQQDADVHRVISAWVRNQISPCLLNYPQWKKKKATKTPSPPL